MKYFHWTPLIEPFKRTVNESKRGLHKLDIKKEGKNQFRNFLGEFENFINSKNIDEIKGKIHRKIKKIRVYRLNNFGGRIVKELKVIAAENFSKHFNINKTNRVVGYTPNYVGFRPGYPVNFNNIIVKIINENYTSIRENFPRIFLSLKNSLINFREVFSGSYDTNSGHLLEFLKDDSTKFSAEDIIKDCADSPWLNSPYNDVTNIDDLPYVMNYNPESHCGHYTMRVFDCRLKGITIMPALILAKKKFELIKRYAIKNFTLWDIFAREKDMKVDNTSFSTRVVLSTEHYQITLLSYFFQRLMVSLESFSKVKFNLKGEYDGSKSFNLLKRSFNYDFVIDADWPKFDSSIDSEYLLAAGAIMFSNCLSTKESFRVIFHLISSFITKYIVIPPGIIVELNRGNPSGHPGVTSINCFVNIIRWIQIGRGVYGDKYFDYMDIEVYGDDAYVFFKKHPNLKNIDTVVEELGFAKLDIYARLFPTSLLLVDVDSAPDFLKRKFSLNGLCWNLEKVIDKLIYQSKRRNIDNQIELIKGFVTTAPGDSEFNNFCIYLIDKISKRLSLNYSNEISYINIFLENVKRFNLCDQKYKTSQLGIINTLKTTQQVNLERYDEEMLNAHKVLFDKDLLKAFFMLSENGVYTKYMQSVWKNKKSKVFEVFNDFDFGYIIFNNVSFASKFKKLDTS